jgi:hypothetical protein
MRFFKLDPAFQHLLPGGIFIVSLVIGMYALAQGREVRRYSARLPSPTNQTKKTLKELEEEMQVKYPPQSDYEMKQV